MKIIDKLGRIITYLLIGLISVIAIFIIYSYISLNILDKDYVSILNYTYFEVASGSMEPAINKNDLVIVKITNDYKVGDVVTYYNDGEFITHRIIDIGVNTIITKGDANNTRDIKIVKDNVLGKVCLVIPKFGIWKRVIMTPKVFALLVITLILFSFTFSYNTKSKRKKLKKQREKRLAKDNNIKSEDIPIKK